MKVNDARAYNLVKQDNGKTPLADLARQLGTRRPNLIDAVVSYAQTTGKPIPTMLMHQPKNARTSVSRRSESAEIRISSAWLANAGLGKVLDFELSPERGRLVIKAASAREEGPRVETALIESAQQAVAVPAGVHFEPAAERGATTTGFQRRTPTRSVANATAGRSSRKKALQKTR